MSLIQQFLPGARHTEMHRVFVNADAASAWNAARHADMATVPWVRLLFDIRTLPDRWKGKLKDEDRRLGIDQITGADSGFMLGAEITGKEVVIISIGKFWKPGIPFIKVTPDEFISFNEPGYGKLAWSIAVEPFMEGSIIRLELRITATDDLSWKNFHNYYRVIGFGSRLIRNFLMHRLEKKLGKLKRPDDANRKLEGDDLLPESRYQITRTIDIEAPPSIVWSYLMQLGCDRGGWYSIDALDNGGKRSIGHLMNGLPDRKSSDKIWATPKGDGFFDVISVEREKHLVMGAETRRLGGPYKMTWSFIPEPLGERATHLVTRVRMEARPRLAEWIMGTLIGPPVHSLMQKTQFRNLKKLCEKEVQLEKA